MTRSEFSKLVGTQVKERYDLDDGSSLCFNLLEMDVITIDMGVDAAAATVAQFIEQP